MRPGDISLPGAVDLSGLRNRPQQPAGGAAGAGSSAAAGGAVVDVTEATFATEVVERSRQVPVVLDFWASWCGPCRQLSPVLEKLAGEGGGAWVLAKIDCDANPRLAQAAGVQGIPAVKAVVDGAIVSEFTGALPEPRVRQWLDEVLAFAGQQGGGAVDSAGADLDPAYDVAEQALSRGDLDAARAAYQDLADRNPADPLARTALARVDLIARARGYDQQAVRGRAADAPDDVEAQCAVADLDLAAGHVEDAFGRLIDVVRRSAGVDRDRARAHLLSLFDILDPEDPRLAKARRDLANALF